MTTREYLRQIKELEIKINQRKKQAEGLKEKALSPGSVTAKPDPVQTSPKGDVIDRRVAAYVDMEREVQEMLAVLEKLRNRIIGQIHRLDKPEHIDILHRRYVECQRYRDIAKEMEYSYDRVKHMIREAEKEFDKVCKVSTF